jgi:hypothetical protein
MRRVILRRSLACPRSLGREDIGHGVHAVYSQRANSRLPTACWFVVYLALLFIPFMVS